MGQSSGGFEQGIPLEQFLHQPLGPAFALGPGAGLEVGLGTMDLGQNQEGLGGSTPFPKGPAGGGLGLVEQDHRGRGLLGPEGPEPGHLGREEQPPPPARGWRDGLEVRLGLGQEGDGVEAPGMERLGAEERRLAQAEPGAPGAGVAAQRSPVGGFRGLEGDFRILPLQNPMLGHSQVGVAAAEMEFEPRGSHG